MVEETNQRAIRKPGEGRQREHPLDRERMRAAVARNPRQMTLQLARAAWRVGGRSCPGRPEGACG